MLLTSNGGGGVRPPLVLLRCPPTSPYKRGPICPSETQSNFENPTNLIQLDQITFPIGIDPMADHRPLITATLALLAASSVSAVPFLSSSASASSQRHPNVDLGTMLSMGGGRVMAAEDLPPELRRTDPQPMDAYGADAAQARRQQSTRAAPASAAPKSDNAQDSELAPPPNWWRAAEAQVRAQPMERFLPPQQSLAPTLSGWIRAEPQHQNNQKPASPDAADAHNDEAVIDPAAFYLAGANLDKVRPPKCRLMGCTGPLPNDGDIAVEGRTAPGAGGTRSCHQTFIPMNGCWEGRGYPVGMVCTICCDCSAELGAEMRKTFGWTHQYRP